MDGLHVKKQIEQILGCYFEGSDLTDMLVTSIVMSNSDKSFLSGSFLTKSRCNNVEQSPSCIVSASVESSVETIVNFKFWYSRVELIIRFLIFIRSIRDADIGVYIDMFSC